MLLLIVVLARPSLTDSGIILGDMNPDQLAALEKSPMSYARKIREKIESLLEERYAKQFDYWLETGRIICRENHSMPLEIHPLNIVSATNS